MEIYSSILVWEIPWTEELGRLQSMGSQELDAACQTNHDITIYIYIIRLIILHI